MQNIAQSKVIENRDNQWTAWVASYRDAQKERQEWSRFLKCCLETYSRVNSLPKMHWDSKWKRVTLAIACLKQYERVD